MITLTAVSKSSTGQYIAQITGRDAKFGFKREFTGRKERGTTTIAYIDEPGLYEICDLDKKGRKDITFVAIIPRPAHCPPLTEKADLELIRFWVGDADATAIARRIGDGEPLADMLEVNLAESGDKYEHRLRAKDEVKRLSDDDLWAQLKETTAYKALTERGWVIDGYQE